MKDLKRGDDQKLKFHQSDTNIYKGNINRHRNIKSMINPLDIDINKDFNKKKRLIFQIQL